MKEKYTTIWVKKDTRNLINRLKKKYKYESTHRLLEDIFEGFDMIKK